MLQDKSHEKLHKKIKYQKPQILDLGQLRNIIQGNSGGSSDMDGISAVPGTNEPPSPFG